MIPFCNLFIWWPFYLVWTCELILTCISLSEHWCCENGKCYTWVRVFFVCASAPSFFISAVFAVTRFRFLLHISTLVRYAIVQSKISTSPSVCFFVLVLYDKLNLAGWCWNILIAQKSVFLRGELFCISFFHLVFYLHFSHQIYKMISYNL